MSRYSSFNPTHGLDRAPVMFTAATVIVLATAFACAVKSDDQSAQNEQKPVATAEPVVVTKPDTATGDVEPLLVIPENVSFATAESTYNDRRYREATSMFEVYVQRRPDNAWGHYMLGLSAWKAGELGVSRTAFERSLEIDPKHVKSLINLSRVLLEQEQPKEALARINTALEIDSASAEVHRVAGRVHTALGDRDAAIASYRVALSLDSTDVWSMNNMGLILIQQGRFDEALPPLARAVQLKPGSPVFQNNLGVALERTGHFALARETYQAAIAADSSYAKASVSLARVTGLTDDPSAEPLELAQLAEQFATEIRTSKVVGARF